MHTYYTYVRIYVCIPHKLRARLSHRVSTVADEEAHTQAATRYFISCNLPILLFLLRFFDWHCLYLASASSSLPSVVEESSWAICAPMVLWPPPAYSATKGIGSKLRDSYEHPYVALYYIIVFGIVCRIICLCSIYPTSVGQRFWRNQSRFS